MRTLQSQIEGKRNIFLSAAPQLKCQAGGIFGILGSIGSLCLALMLVASSAVRVGSFVLPSARSSPFAVPGVCDGASIVVSCFTIFLSSCQWSG